MAGALLGVVGMWIAEHTDPIRLGRPCLADLIHRGTDGRPRFDFERAVANGHDERAVLAAAARALGFDLKAAQRAGYTPAEIINLMQSTQAAGAADGRVAGRGTVLGLGEKAWLLLFVVLLGLLVALGWALRG